MNVQAYDAERLLEKQLEEYRAATSVRAETFTASGKWKYTVRLDYSATETLVHRPSGWINPVEAAEFALRLATRRGTSEVTFSELPAGWSMFVPDPPNGWPIMVQRGR